MARNNPYYRRNKAHVCSFWVKGECTRGASCPYRHETDEHDEALGRQNFKDRYYGTNDPVAGKMMGTCFPFKFWLCGAGLAGPSPKTSRCYSSFFL